MEPGAAPAHSRRPHVDAARTASDGTHPRTAAPILLDVRERHEFAAVRVPGALLYPTSSFLLRFSELPRDRPIHVICHTGSRSAAVTSFLLRNGWTQVYTWPAAWTPGSARDWRSGAGRSPPTKATRPTER